MRTIAIVDYGMSNLHSVQRALCAANAANWRIRVVNAAGDIEEADKVVFPGQGAARDCMRKLAETGLDAAILKASREKPFLGICMGMQVLFERSDENNGTDCLGVFPGSIHHLSRLGKPRAGRKIPHLGWNQVRQSDHPMWHGISDNAYFYFVHSYYPIPDNDEITVGTCSHGGRFTCSVAEDLIFAAQFHPEKSADNGLQLLRNFCAW